MAKFIVRLSAFFLSASILVQASLLGASAGEASTHIVSASNFGAKGDGQTLNTSVLQAAIDATPAGGVLQVDAGQYVTGTLKLKSDFELQLMAGAELLGSTSIDDYARDIEGAIEAIEAPAFDECLIYAKNAHNVKITGEGVINGRGHRETFPVKTDGTLNDRPMLIRFVDCSNVTFMGITLMNAASWCTHMVDCDNLIFKNVTLDSHVNTNNDGFDLDGCKNVLFEDCNIHSGDDGICPKSTTGRIFENLVVRNCRITSHTSAFKCGTSSAGGFRNISISDCDFSDTRMGAIKLMIVDGGILEGIRVSNIVMNNVEGPLFIRLGNRGRTYGAPTEQIYGEDAKSEGAPPGIVRDIHISDIRATVISEDSARCGIMISGIPGHFVENVTLENIQISYPGGGTEEQAKYEVPEHEARYPEPFFFGTLPSWGAYVRHARNVEFKNVSMNVRSADAREKIVLVDVEGFQEH